MALLMPVRGRFSVNTHTVAVGERKSGMEAWWGVTVEGRRFAFNEGKAGRHTLDDSHKEGRLVVK